MVSENRNINLFVLLFVYSLPANLNSSSFLNSIFQQSFSKKQNHTLVSAYVN